jgi:hypothetical protein
MKEDNEDEDKMKEDNEDEDKMKEDNEDENCYQNFVKVKIQFLITYVFTAGVSIALIILTFTI